MWYDIQISDYRTDTVRLILSGKLSASGDAKSTAGLAAFKFYDEDYIELNPFKIEVSHSEK